MSSDCKASSLTMPEHFYMTAPEPLLTFPCSSSWWLPLLLLSSSNTSLSPRKTIKITITGTSLTLEFLEYWTFLNSFGDSNSWETHVEMYQCSQLHRFWKSLRLVLEQSWGQMVHSSLQIAHQTLGKCCWRIIYQCFLRNSFSFCWVIHLPCWNLLPRGRIQMRSIILLRFFVRSCSNWFIQLYHSL